ncbi:MAG: hypothetical protein JSV20_09680 [Candidatus Bathyarchaeota archaeon]|nr:MAG: hypothetical protein JSV20_09680 [Candidatus Bathyarchaeota archaeon]
MAEPYNYVRFRWWNEIDFEKIERDLAKSFDVERITVGDSGTSLSLIKDYRERLKVSADTLKVRLSGFRAVLYQQKAAPFTTRDLALRRQILKLYPRNRPTGLPWLFTHEPKYDVAKSDNQN